MTYHFVELYHHYHMFGCLHVEADSPEDAVEQVMEATQGMVVHDLGWVNVETSKGCGWTYMGTNQCTGQFCTTLDSVSRWARRFDGV